MKIKLSLLSLLVSISFMGPTHSAVADDEGGSVKSTTDQARADAWKTIHKTPVSPTGESVQRQTGKSKYTYVPKDEYERRTAERTKQVRAAIARNLALRFARNECQDNPALPKCGQLTNVPIPDELNIRPAGDPAPAAPALAPEELAYLASVRLTINAPKPMIGPPPSINQWKMAAVGYPMWLWAEGNLNPAPVSESVYDVSVALDARLVKVTYDMGDGRKVTCTNVTRKWTRAVKPGAKSPTCGYTYQKPSLPKGSYTITADAVWAVDWQINGDTGTIPFFNSATTELPVGELQVLVR